MGPPTNAKGCLLLASTRSRLCYLTGVPGVGKTTTARLLAELDSARFTRVSFGELILEVLRRESANMSEGHLRVHGRELVTSTLLQTATGLLQDRISAASTQWVVIDSHAVSQYGTDFVADPDGPSFFSEFLYDAIVHLRAEPAVVLARTQRDGTGRQAESVGDLAFHDQLLTAVSTLYASLSSCRAFFLNADRTPVDVGRAVISVLSKVAA